jgi:DNA-binding LacI/PurR family transcriptional regulator
MIFVCNSMDEPLEAWRFFNQLLSKGVDGIIVASQPFEQFFPDEGKSTGHELTGVPYVSIDWPESPSYSVVMDLESAGYLATQHLVEHGHRRIGLVTFSFFDPEDRPEYIGYQRALEGAGIKVDPELIAYMQSFGVDAGRRGAARLLKLPSPPSAIFFITDLMAAGAMQEIKGAGLQVPQDIALVGFNDIPLASLMDPPLTTVSTPGRRLGVEGMKLLKNLINGTKPKRRQIVLPTSLVVRRSCGCP